MKEEQKRQHLGSYLKNQTITNVEIYIKTGIDPTRISKLSNPKRHSITADEFYLIALAIGADIDDMAGYVFEDFKLREGVTGLTKGDGRLTKYGRFLNNGLISQKAVFRRTGITVTKLSALANDPHVTLFAKDVYLTALAIHKKPGEAFKFICGHRKLNTAREQERLRKAYQAELAAAKSKRNAEKSTRPDGN